MYVLHSYLKAIEAPCLWRCDFGRKVPRPFISAIFCFVRFFGIFIFMLAFLTTRVVFVLVHNSSQSSPLSRMKFVILWKAWYVTGCAANEYSNVVGECFWRDYSFLCVQFVPLSPKEMRHKHISYDSYVELSSLETREMRHHTQET